MLYKYKCVGLSTKCCDGRKKGCVHSTLRWWGSGQEWLNRVGDVELCLRKIEIDVQAENYGRSAWDPLGVTVHGVQ
jgi:hypothetical protein